MMSVSTTCFSMPPSALGLETKPADMPATEPKVGTPASMSASEPPQTLAMEVEPFEVMISEIKRMA